jgi:hypothetical protein
MAPITTIVDATTKASGTGKSCAVSQMVSTLYTERWRLSLGPTCELSEIFSISTSPRRRSELVLRLRKEITQAISDELSARGVKTARRTRSRKATLPSSSSDDLREDRQW